MNLELDEHFNLAILLSIEYVYIKALHKPKCGLVGNAIKSGNINNEKFMDDTIYQFEQDYLPPTGNLAIGEKMVADLLVKSYKEKSRITLFEILKPGFDHIATNGI